MTKNSGNKQNLRDVTFLFLVRLDTIDRLENILAVTNFFIMSVETNIVVLECAPFNNGILEKLLDKNIIYTFQEDHDPILYRTKFLNQMTKSVEQTVRQLIEIHFAIHLFMKKKGKYKISLSVMLLLGVVFVLIFSNSCFCYVPEKPLYVKFTNCDTVAIDGKIMFPLVEQNDKVVIYVAPSLNTQFIAIYKGWKTEKKYIELKIRDKLLENGCVYFEFSGRKDSIWINNRRYPVSTMYTKAQDLEAAIAYVQTRADLKNKKIVLIGQSEGGMIAAMVTSKNPNVHAIALISSGALYGYETMKYQSKCTDSLFMETFGTHQEVLDILYGYSSVKETKNYEPNFDGYNRYKKDMFDPLINIVYRYENYDTIAAHVIRFLEKKWSKEDDKTKALHKDFIRYCNAHQYSSFIQPENLAKIKWQPELYFPNIKCPVLSVHGTKDRNIEYSSSIKNTKELLAKGGNHNFTFFTLKDHDHRLEPPVSKPSYAIQDSCVNKVVDWIVRQ